MKPDFVKICGLSTAPTLEAVIEGGATHAGFIFFPKSPRYLEVSVAADLAAVAGGRITSVAVTVDADDGILDEIASTMRPDMLQLHGSETPERVRDLKTRHGLPVIKAVSVADAADLQRAAIYEQVADRLLLDAKPPEGSVLPGGNGVAFDWSLMDRWTGSVPYILSGGLARDNVAEAVARSGTNAIDVSSGVESSPGVKETGLIRDFLRTVREM